MVGLALFVVGLFGLATYNVRLYLETLEERVEVVAYLRDDATTADIAVMETALTMLPEVLGVDFVTKAEALEKALGDNAALAKATGAASDRIDAAVVRLKSALDA